MAYHGMILGAARLLQEQNRQWEEFRKGRSSTMPAFINVDALFTFRAGLNPPRDVRKYPRDR